MLSFINYFICKRYCKTVMNYLNVKNFLLLQIQDGQTALIRAFLCTNLLKTHLPNYWNLQGLEDHLTVKHILLKHIYLHNLFSFLGGDQGLLNMFFKDWSHKDISKHLSFTYNVVWSSTYSYLPALKQ